jgi:hypothetical protein
MPLLLRRSLVATIGQASSPSSNVIEFGFDRFHHRRGDRLPKESEDRPLIMTLTKSTVATIDQRSKDDPDFGAAIDAELLAMQIEQELVALRSQLFPIA